MKLRSLVVAVAAFAMAGSALAQDVSSEKGKLSYYFGYDYGNNLAELTGRGEQLDINSVVKGLQDAYAKKQPAITAEQLKPAVEAFQKREQGRAQAAKAEYEKVAAENKTRSDQFMAANKAKAGVQTLPSGVQYRVIETGNGAKPTQASTVQLQVAGPFAQRNLRHLLLAPGVEQAQHQPETQTGAKAQRNRMKQTFVRLRVDQRQSEDTGIAQQQWP